MIYNDSFEAAREHLGVRVGGLGARGRQARQQLPGGACGARLGRELDQDVGDAGQRHAGAAAGAPAAFPALQSSTWLNRLVNI